MLAFHEAHFSHFATDHFHSHFFRPDPPSAEEPTYNEADEEYYEEDEDDGLGYYPDGVKRTLTDEQIAIFRHSELEALRRAKESSSDSNNKAMTATPQEDASHDMSEGEVSSSTQPAAAASNKKKKKKRKRGKNKSKGNNNGGEPIDLRKRTWDVVDKGLATLDYDEEETEPAQANAAQRRRISYDD